MKLSQIRSSGGAEQRHHAKGPRPFSPKASLHIVLRSARRGPVLQRQARKVQSFSFELAKRLGVRIYEYGNAGNHLHLLVLAPTRKALNAFLRGLAGTLARIAGGGKKGSPVGDPFWLGRPYTRIVSWGREFHSVKNYVVVNAMEGVAQTHKQMAKYIVNRILESKAALKPGETWEIKGLG